MAAAPSRSALGAGPPSPDTQPADPRSRGAAAVAADPGQFAVDMFVSMNWPAQPNARGVPNADGRLGQAGATVWETYKNSSEMYLPGGAAPCAWGQVCELPGGITPPTLGQLQKSFGTADSAWLHFLSEDRMIDGQQVVDANTAVICYDVRCNRDHFSYVVNNPSGYALYTLEGQELALGDTSFTFSFPASAIEVKASWRMLGPKDDDSRYWTAYGAHYDANQKLVYSKIGLTGFHISSRISPGWVWLTYEQADYPTATFKYFLGKTGAAVGPNPTANPDAASYNQKLRGLTAGTKWQFYQIIGWQTAEVSSAGAPVILANSDIETYFPRTSSCMSCHAMANIGPASHVRLDMWSYANGGITGRVGTIDFAAIARKLDPGDSFKQMDSVWSLREAQSTRAGTAKAGN
jgi:hypothetical protein